MPLFSDAAPRTGSPLIRLAAGEVYVPPAGWYFVSAGVVNIQKYDSRAGVWRYAGDPGNNMDTSFFDGLSVRLANTSGCAVAAVLTNAGTNYTSSPTVTASAGGSAWTAIVGGAVSTTATITAVGAGYVYPPLLLIEQPPFPGIQATGYCTIASGTISAVTIDNQGAGYLYPPQVTLLNDARDTVGYGGAVTVGLTGANTVTAVVCTNHGNPITSNTVPTLTFAGGGGSSAAATVLMDWSVASVSVSAAGAGYTSAAAVITASGAGGYNTASPAYVGTDTSLDMMRWRAANIAMTTNASGGMTTNAIVDGGRYLANPSPIITAAQTYTTVGTLVFTMGGVNSTVLLWPAQQ